MQRPRPPESPLLRIVSTVRQVELPAVVVAHRGDSQNAPENTLAAFALAAAHGAEMVEFDVHPSADGEVMVIHDDKVDRTTDGRGEVQRLTAAQLRELSAGAWFSPRYRGERVPTLDEVLDLCRARRVVPMIEVKSRRRRSPDLGLRIVAALQRHGLAERAVVICRELGRVEEVHGASPATPICYVTYTKRQAMGATRLAGVRGVDCYWKSLSSRLLEQLRAASFFLTPWTVNRPRDMDRLLQLGCEAIITDCPVVLRDRIEHFELLRSRGELEPGGEAAEVDLEAESEGEPDSPEETSRTHARPSEVDLLDVDWPEDPPG